MNIVAVSAHRKAAIEAVAWAIDELKTTVPIWKKEFYEETEEIEPQWKKNPEYNELKNQVKDY